MKYLSLFVLLFLWSCASTPSSTKPSKFDTSYYQDLGKNIKRIHQLFQGSFVAYSAQDEEKWKLSDGDSIILFTQQLGEIAKDGYWVYNYEFMSSLPDDPIYTSIKQIRQISRDSFEILYYRAENHYTLSEMLNEEQPFRGKKFDLTLLEKRDKRVIFVRQEVDHFEGKSSMYFDSRQDCYRQNTYEITPHHYQVKVDFFDKETRAPIQKDERPNLMIRRPMAYEDFWLISTGEKLKKNRRAKAN